MGEGLAVQNSELQSCLTVGEGLAVQNSELQSCLTVGEGLAVQNSELQSVLQWEGVGSSEFLRGRRGRINTGVIVFNQGPWAFAKHVSILCSENWNLAFYVFL